MDFDFDFGARRTRAQRRRRRRYRGMDPNEIMYRAIEAHDTVMINQLVARGVDVNAVDADGESVLISVHIRVRGVQAQEQFIRYIEYLETKGFQLDDDIIHSLLKEAIHDRHFHLIRYLVEQRGARFEDVPYESYDVISNIMGECFENPELEPQYNPILRYCIQHMAPIYPEHLYELCEDYFANNPGERYRDIIHMIQSIIEETFTWENPPRYLRSVSSRIDQHPAATPTHVNRVRAFRGALHRQRNQIRRLLLNDTNEDVTGRFLEYFE